MTATALTRIPDAPPGTPRRRRVPVALLAMAAFLLTGAVRLVGVGPSADLFVDELIYRELGMSAAQGGFPRNEDGLFFLHPPGFFYLQAGWGELFGFEPDVVTGVYDIRVLNALLAACTAVLLLLLVVRLASRTAGAVAALLFALDPYIIRQNNRAMLDTETMMWTLAGYLVLFGLIRTPLPKRARTRAAGAGLLFGLALLTKDHSALITLLPLGCALLLGWGPPRKLLLITVSTAVVPYGLYVAAVAAAGHFDAFLDAKSAGVRRLLGLVQESGFNAPGTPSLADRLADELTLYGSTYVLLALGPAALVLLWRSKAPARRMLALFQLCAGLTLLYALAKGTLEEQALYLLIVPNLAALTVAFSGRTRPRPHRAPRPARHRTARVAAVALLAATTAFASTSYAAGRLQDDDGYARLRSYMSEHIPAGTPVAAIDGGATRGISTWALRDRYRLGEWLTPQDRAEAQARYLVIPWKVIEEGYGGLDERQARSLAAEGKLLFSTHGRTYGTLALYELPPLAPAAPGTQGGGHGR
ncbi:phospholipid carrier-dependent glycosyltransferase [Streptomyces sp. TRM49041]|uniref:phospholipid carrier-dependent glycosyltransferase n=1 Tax=Streptomyces sp. TRM49041 TaxID=2603216 RepID=UPI0011F007E5|nr:glycosyltransferase family 39 protein [Streptomyces sp. TRM49041]